MDFGRRDFIKASAFAAAGATLGGCAGRGLFAGKPQANFIWGDLIHLGMNMWGDLPRDKWSGWANMENDAIRDAVRAEYVGADHVRFDEDLWPEVSEKFRAEGTNLLLIDLGEGIVYPSHPEIAVKGSWSVDKFRRELKRLRGMGFEVIPKINFSATHDLWLGEYHKMVSTPQYYQVCADLIRDVRDIFDGPRFVHLGLDEEVASFQTFDSMVVLRQGDLWWHDFNFYLRECEKNGMQAWIWSDYLRRHPLEEFKRKMSTSVIQSPWCYSGEIDPAKNKTVKIYQTLAENGYDVIPCASNCYQSKDNFVNTVEFCAKSLPLERLRGFLMAPWCEMNKVFRGRHFEAASQIGEARERVRRMGVRR